MPAIVTPPSRAVDAYIARAPRPARARLVELRKLLRDLAPDATELISYQMPGYSYPGYDYKGMFAWFALQARHVGLYLRPPTIAEHSKELEAYGTTKSAVHLPFDRPIPAVLVRRLVRASLRTMRSGGRAPRAGTPGRTPPRRRPVARRGSDRARRR